MTYTTDGRFTLGLAGGARLCATFDGAANRVVVGDAFGAWSLGRNQSLALSPPPGSYEEREISPAVEVRDGVARVEMSGGCQGCAASALTLQAMVRRMISSRVPEVGETRITFPLDYPYDDLEIGDEVRFAAAAGAEGALDLKVRGELADAIEVCVWYDEDCDNVFEPTGTGRDQELEVALVSDVSGSMSGAPLSALKTAATDFVETVEQANFGLVSFSGYPSIEQPLSDDVAGVVNSIQNLEIQRVSGTDIPGALITATNLLAVSERGRVVVLFTDGSSTTGNSVDDPVTRAVNYALEHDVVVHAVGVGSTQGGPSGYLPSLYNVSSVYDTEELAYITNSTGGELLTAESTEELNTEFAGLLSDPQSRNKTLDVALGFLLAALALLFLEWGLANTRYRFIP